jgi:hypothetical protein
MLQFGLNITAANDELQRIPVDRLYQAIARPKESFRTQVHRLRLVRGMDAKRYNLLKRELPYFVCGHFHPPYRRREHFSAIQHFVVDLDHFAEADKDRLEVAGRLCKDPRLLLLFTSPGGDGLKLLFGLKEKCFDAGLYTLFYKAFTHSMARQYGLESVIDWRTHDVTRACFLSVDPDAHFNPEAEPVVLEQFFDSHDPEAQRRVAEDRKAIREEAPARPKPDKEPLSDEVLLEIKQKLNPNFRPRKKPDAYVPPQLEEIMPGIEERLREVNMEIAFTEAIQYGKKIRVAAGTHWAEVNVFFGKRGFSVVKTTKAGSKAELAEMAYQVLCELLGGG